MSNADLEEGRQLLLDFSKLRGIAEADLDVIPVVAQHIESKDVLVLAYVNQEAVAHSLKTGIATFWSTSRNELWVKGATSGDELELIEVRVNCEQNSLLYLVRPKNKGVCHTKDAAGNTRRTCFYRKIDGDDLEFVH